MTIHYEKLNTENFNIHSLDRFVRHQQIKECWRNVEGQWKLLPIEFEENWSTEQCQKIAADVALHMVKDQTAIGAFDGEEAKQSGADKMYISAHSSKESQAAYKALGCVHAIEINRKLAEEEPCDVQLEYVLD